MQLGIVGLPNVGKTTLFNALTMANAPVANYPFCTIDRNVGVSNVPDERLWKLSEILSPAKTTPATVEFVDIAGLVKGASHGEGLGNEFLGHIRNVDAIIHVVRCFEDENVAHVSGRIDPVVDMDIVNSELLEADIKTLERRLEKVNRSAKSGDKNYIEESHFLTKLLEFLRSGTQARDVHLSSDTEVELIKSYNLLTYKKMLYVANIGEVSASDNLYFQMAKKVADEQGIEVIPVSSKIELELNELEPEERKVFIEEMGIGQSSLEKLVWASYKLLDLITFFTGNENELRAWSITKGSHAPKAAGKVHSDMEKGFIKAEVIHYDDLIACGSMKLARERGLIHLEGKDYVVMDGDILYFRFQV